MCRIGLGFEQALQYIWSFRIARLGARLVVLALFMRFAVYAVQAFYEFQTFNYLILLVGEVITMSLVVLARDTKKVRLTLVALLAAVAGSFYYLCFSFNLGAQSIVPLVVSEAVQVFGVIFQIYAKLCLGRSFGLIPANRGVVTVGAYRLVRHPIYLGYLLGHVGFILGAFSIHNFAALVVLYFFQGIRILEEEKILREEPTYVGYAAKVRWRAIPGLF